MGNTKSRYPGNCVSPESQPLLHQTVREGDVLATKNLLATNVDVNIADDKGTTALHIAVELEQVECVLCLLEKNADISCHDLCRMNVLHFAAGIGNEVIVKLLIDNSSKSLCNEQDIWGWTPLHRAIIHHKFSVAEILIAHGCLVNVPDENKRVVLHVAASYGQVDLMKTIFKAGADINWQDIRGRTPLYLAVVGKHPLVVEELISQGCNVNIANSNGMTPLALAAQKGHLDCVHALIKGGAYCCNQRQQDSRTPYVSLESALLRTLNKNSKKYMDYINIIQILLEADGNAPSPQAYFLAYKSLQQGASEEMLHIMYLLFAAGIQPDPPTINVLCSTDQMIADWIQHYIRRALPLQEICRRAVRSHLQQIHGNLVTTVPELGIPSRMKDFLLLRL